jgi:hypothetical protein
MAVLRQQQSVSTSQEWRLRKMGIQTIPAPASGGVTQKVEEFTSTGTFATPSNVSSVELLMYGGGGGAGGINTENANKTGGGGGGGGVFMDTITVVPGTSYTVTVGAGGAGGTTGGTTGSLGTDTTFGALATAFGGGGGGGRANNIQAGTVRGTSGGEAARICWLWRRCWWSSITGKVN